MSGSQRNPPPTYRVTRLTSRRNLPNVPTSSQNNTPTPREIVNISESPVEQPINNGVVEINSEENNNNTGEPGIDGDGTTSRPNPNPNSNTNPTTDTVIPEPLTEAKISELLFEYKKTNTKVIKGLHHLEFLQECRNKRKTPAGLQLKFDLNAVDQDNGLKGRILGILITAEMEIMEELVQHYDTLNQSLSKRLKEIQTTLSQLEKDKPTITNTYEDSKREGEILKYKLKSRREDKIRRYLDFDDRIKAMEQNDDKAKRYNNRQVSQPNTHTNYNNRPTIDMLPPSNHRNPPPTTPLGFRDLPPTSPRRQAYRPPLPLYHHQQRSPPQYNRYRYRSPPPPPMPRNIFNPSSSGFNYNHPQYHPNQYPLGNRPMVPEIERQLGDLVKGMSNFVTQIQVLSESFRQPDYRTGRGPY